jgi:ribosomal protein L7/L12
MYQHENTVGLVKLVRNIYGLSLKEALDSVRNGTWLKYYGEIADLQKKSKAAGVGIIVVSKPNPPEYDLPINLQAH